MKTIVKMQQKTFYTRVFVMGIGIFPSLLTNNPCLQALDYSESVC